MYEKAVQPYVSKHESTIDWGIAELKQRSWDLVLHYWYKSVDMSSKNFIQCLQLLMTQVMNAALSRPQAQVSILCFTFSFYVLIHACQTPNFLNPHFKIFKSFHFYIISLYYMRWLMLYKRF